MQNTVSLLSIQEVILKKSYKNNIDKLNVDIKTLINPNFQQPSNLFPKPNPQRLPSPTYPPQLESKSSTVYLKSETIKIRKHCSSRQRIARTEGNPTRENSFNKGRLSTQTDIKDSRPMTSCKQSKLHIVQQQNMAKTLNSFLFKMDLPQNLKKESKGKDKLKKEGQGGDKDSPNKTESDDLQEQRIKIETFIRQTLNKAEIKGKKRQEKIPEFIRINIEIEQRKNKEIPKASLIFAQRRVKSVLRFTKKRSDNSRQPVAGNSKSPCKVQNEFITIQPQITQIKLIQKAQKRPKTVGQCYEFQKIRRSASKQSKRRLLTEKFFEGGKLCGWDNQQNQNLNYF